MSNYLVLGGAGFIGAHVTEVLLAQGHFVHCIDNLSDYYSPELKQWRIGQLAQSQNFCFHEADIENAVQLHEFAGGFGAIDGVIHLAARAGVRPSVQDPRAYFDTNVMGTLNVLDLCRKLEIPKLVAASSSSVYGDHNPMPYQEDADTNRPLSPYAASKKAGETICFTYHHLYQTDISLLRFFTVYGPAGRPDMSMFRFIKSIVEAQPLTVLGDGNQVRDFSFVGDIARGVIAALQPVGCRVFNLGANRPVKLNLVIETIEKLSSRKAIIHHKPADPTDVAATWADVSRARNELGWEPTVGLEQGICGALRWYMANREWASAIS